MTKEEFPVFDSSLMLTVYSMDFGKEISLEELQKPEGLANVLDELAVTGGETRIIKNGKHYASIRLLDGDDPVESTPRRGNDSDPAPVLAGA
ncbi:MAG: hypothetical protein JWL80_649 [Parcubacteria group bacterium]|nr:hypothetical protein [Parcubacteria group bacterium]